MTEMYRFPGLFRRGNVFWYRRRVPEDIKDSYGKKEVVFSLKTNDPKAALRKARKAAAGLDDQFEAHRNGREDPECQSNTGPRAGSDLPRHTIRQWCQDYYHELKDRDFQHRAEQWNQVQADEKAFWAGEIIDHPKNDWHEYNGQQYSYYAHLMEEADLNRVFEYCVFLEQKMRLAQTMAARRVRDRSAFEEIADAIMERHGIEDVSELSRHRLMRKLMDVEVTVLEEIMNSDDARFDPTKYSEPAMPVGGSAPAPVVSANGVGGALFSDMIEKHIHEGERGDWPKKTVMRKRQYLEEYMEVVGDKAITAYTIEDGEAFRDLQLRLPANRKLPIYKGFRLIELAKKADALPGERLSPRTINDKLSAVATFFRWAKVTRKGGENPTEGLAIRQDKRKKGKNRYPFTIDELNLLFSAPVYTGCKSVRHWKTPGDKVLRDSAKFWVPLIGLYTGARLGEIVQLHVADVQEKDGIHFFSVTDGPGGGGGAGDDNSKSLKTDTSRRQIPIHRTLLDIGLLDLVARRRADGGVRLFPDYGKADDDGSWSKIFGKYFRNFRRSVGVDRLGVNFHSFRHNMEDALRNADVRKDVRDAIQGHGENGVSANYGTGMYLRTLNEALQKVEYRGLDLSHLRT